MIIILTNGTELTRTHTLTDLKTLLNFDLINNIDFLQQKHELESTAMNGTNKVITCCFMKSQRYEIFCIARRFKIPFCIINVINSLNEDFEPFNGKYDSPIISSNNLKQILQITRIAPICKANLRIITPTSDYLVRVIKIIEGVNDENRECWFLEKFKKSILGLLNRSMVPIGEFEEWYRNMLENEIRSKRIQ